MFKSRLGLANLVLGVTTFGHQPDRALQRRVRQKLEERVEVPINEPSSERYLQYLLDKKLVGREIRRSGRYRGLSLAIDDRGTWHAASRDGEALRGFPIYKTDIWLAAPEIPSTIGVPTPENVDEVIEFTFQLRLLNKAKNSWLSDGHLANGLRNLSSATIPDTSNPFLLGAEGAGLLRSLLERDGFLLRELLRFLDGASIVKRDDVARALPSIAERALEAAEGSGVSPQVASAGRKLVKKFWGATDSSTETSRASSRPASRRPRARRPDAASSAPGMLEHRTSPRLEWLTDLGYLTKAGLAKNSFEYRVTERVPQLLSRLDESLGGPGDWSLKVALATWQENDYWTPIRDALATENLGRALLRAYEALRRPIGPVPLRDVVFITGMLHPPKSPDETIERVIELTRETPGASLSGGRVARGPENIYMTDEALRILGRS